MHTHFESAFRQGALRQLRSYGQMEKSAVGPLLAMGANAVRNVVTPALPRALNAAGSLPSAAPAVTNTLGSGVRGALPRVGNWARQNPGKVTAGTGAVTAGLGAYGGASFAENKAKEEFGTALSSMKNVGGEWMQQQGGFGRLMMMLSYLFGNKGAVQRNFHDFTQYAGSHPSMSPYVRDAFQKYHAKFTPSS